MALTLTFQAQLTRIMRQDISIVIIAAAVTLYSGLQSASLAVY